MRGLDIVFILGMLVLILLSVGVFFDIFEFIEGHEIIFISIFSILAAAVSVSYSNRKKNQA